MQRRTNLFYTQGDDSKFITFSNYTESLTGNFLATDWKMFPSKFICMKIPSLTTDNRADFIHYLVKYYENKLAFVRDWCIRNNKKIDEYTLPLAWLFEAINKKFDDAEITFISEIVEQNYNGVYADTICTIDGTDYPRDYSFVEQTAESKLYYIDENDISYNLQYLYGWYKVSDEGEIEYTGISNYEGDEPKFDGVDDAQPYYFLDTNLASIKIGETVKEDIEFNIIIPLYDLVNMNTTTNINVIDEEINLTSQIGTNDEDKINIPLGIWFADEMISLNRDNLTGYAPAWSLVLSSQFKPFPYSDKLNDDEGSVYADQAYVTFAQVLANQNELLATFSNLSSQIANLSNRLESLETKLSSMGTSYAIDGLHKEMILFEQHINNIIDASYTTSSNALTWSTKFNS